MCLSLFNLFCDIRIEFFSIKMPATCALASCDLRRGQFSADGSNSKLALFTFPKDPERIAICQLGSQMCEV